MSLVVGYLTNLLTSGHPSVTVGVGFGGAVICFLALVAWDAAHQPGRVGGPSVSVRQRVGTSHGGSVTAMEAEGPINGDYELQQDIGAAENTAIHGIRRSPEDSAPQP